MDIKINFNPSVYTSQKTQAKQNTKETTATPEPQAPNKQDVWEKQPDWNISDMKSICMTEESYKTFREKAKKLSGQLEINWKQVVDPTGQIARTTYVKTLIGSFQTMEKTIEEYYANDHIENTLFSHPYGHIIDKYKNPNSIFFHFDMSSEEREMAFHQEEHLLRGTNVSLNDPYALASLGGQEYISNVHEMAEQAAKDAIDKLIAAYKQEHGIS